MGLKTLKEGENTNAQVSISRTNTPLTGGEYLEVTAAVENTGDVEGTFDVALIVGNNPQTVETQSLTLEEGEQVQLSLGYDTPTIDNDQSFPVRIEAANDIAEQIVTVYGSD